ncbi:hypothetical protein ACOME3_006544 [Neoechinorhynchus agilis]
MFKKDKAYFCNEHPDAELVEDFHAGDLICPLCGAVVGERVVDVSAEWRIFHSDTEMWNKSRVGEPCNEIFDLQYNMATRCDWKSMKLDSATRTTLRRHKQMEKIAESLKIPRLITDQAKGILKRIKDAKPLRGRPEDAIVAACLYIACRQEKAPRTLKEICLVSSANTRDIGKCFKKILSLIDDNVGTVRSQDFIPRFCSRLNMKSEAQDIVRHLSKRVVQLELVDGRAPDTVAAACILMASRLSGLRISIVDIKDVTGVSISSIFKLYRSLLPHSQELCPEDKTCISNLHLLSQSHK